MKEIPLTQGKVALVDDEDYNELSKFKWHAHLCSGHWYAVRRARESHNLKTILMHRSIMNAPTGLMVDHKNGDGLDNQRSNMRLATNSQNAANSKKVGNTRSIYRGVTRIGKQVFWTASIKVNGDSMYLGRFQYERDAALAYDEKAFEVFGEFARLNFPEELRASTAIRKAGQ